MRAYTRMQRAHLDLEESRLITLTDRLPQDERRAIAAGFHDVEAAAGPGAFERHASTVHRLRARWARAS